MNVPADMHPDYTVLIDHVLKLMQVDFSSSHQPRHDCAQQTEVNKKIVLLLAACAVYCNLNFVLVERYLSGRVHYQVGRRLSHS